MDDAIICNRNRQFSTGGSRKRKPGSQRRDPGKRFLFFCLLTNDAVSLFQLICCNEMKLHSSLCGPPQECGEGLFPPDQQKVVQQVPNLRYHGHGAAPRLPGGSLLKVPAFPDTIMVFLKPCLCHGIGHTDGIQLDIVTAFDQLSITGGFPGLQTPQVPADGRKQSSCDQFQLQFCPAPNSNACTGVVFFWISIWIPLFLFNWINLPGSGPSGPQHRAGHPQIQNAWYRYSLPPSVRGRCRASGRWDRYRRSPGGSTGRSTAFE